MSDNNSRLTKLEVSLDFLKDLISEIRSDIKEVSSKEDLDTVKNRIEVLEKSQISMIIKTGIISGFLGIIASSAIKMLF